jgi:monooxygenase
MFSNIPNFSLVFGYTGASWTLKADLAARYLLRLLKEMDASGADIAVAAANTDQMALKYMQTFTSGYVVRDRDSSPKQGEDFPWQIHQDYLTDRKIMLRGPIRDGVLRLVKAGTEWRIPRESAPEQAEFAAAAE